MDASFRLDPDNFARWLRAKNLSRRRISDEYGLSRVNIRRWEKGGPLSRRTAQRLVSEVGVPATILREVACR